MAQSGNTTITLETLAEHKTDDSLWVAVHGSVYDLLSFGPDHPGGIEVLRECAGTDATEPYEYAGHSADAMQKLDEFRIGVLSGTSAASKPSQQSSATARLSTTSGSSVKTTITSAEFNGDGWRQSAIFLSVGLLGAVALVYAAVRANVALSGVYKGNECNQHGRLNAFWAGLIVASTVGCAGAGYGYSIFTKTLQYDNEVFAYPSVIARNRKL